MHHQASPRSRTPWKPPRKPPTISGWGRSSCVFMVRAGTRLISSAGCAYARDHSIEPRRFEASSPQQRAVKTITCHPFLLGPFPASFLRANGSKSLSCHSSRRLVDRSIDRSCELGRCSAVGKHCQCKGTIFEITGYAGGEVRKSVSSTDIQLKCDVQV